MRRHQDVPIGFGSHRAVELELGPFRVTHATFPAGFRIEPHHHDRPNLGIMLDGGFTLRFPRRRDALVSRGTMFVEPAGDVHTNLMGAAGARVLAIQPDPGVLGDQPSARRLFAEPLDVLDPRLALKARRVVTELAAPDDWGHMIAEGLLYEMLGSLGRTVAARRAVSEPPPWLARLRDRLDAMPFVSARVSALARDADVHPSHLAATFRRWMGCSVGSYQLGRRLMWAAVQLEQTERPIAAIAMEAGFSDQSHFTRRFVRAMGLSPGRYRGRLRTEPTVASPARAEIDPR